MALTKVNNRMVDGAVASVIDFGAVGDGTTDDTAAIQAALNASNTVYLPAGSYKITDQLTLPNNALMFGDDRYNSRLVVQNDFNLSANGVLSLGAVHEPGPNLHDFGIYMYQDGTETVRANLIQYPPAIDLATNRAPRTMINRMHIQGAKVGIDASGNNGGTHINNVEIMAYDTGILFNGSLDFCYLSDVEMWPFGYAGTALYTNIWSDGNTTFLDATNVDGLTCNNLTTFQAKIVIDDSFGTIGQISLDGKEANVEFNKSAFAIGSLYSTSDGTSDFAISVTGLEAKINIGSAWIGAYVNMPASDNGLIRLDTASAELVIGDLHVRSVGANTRCVYMTAGSLCIDNAYFQPPQNTSFTSSWIYASGGILTLSNIRVRDKGTGTGNIIEIINDGRHTLDGVIAPGWTVSVPSSSDSMHIGTNEFSTATSGSRRLVETKFYEFSGSFDGSGNAVITHNLPSAVWSSFPEVTAWRNTGSAVIPVTVSSVTSTQISITGGTASGTFNVIVSSRAV
jgi:hypothetical protein